MKALGGIGGDTSYEKNRTQVTEVGLLHYNKALCVK
jgi:hypothetical protein